jgi:hypothetical protein
MVDKRKEENKVDGSSNDNISQLLDKIVQGKINGNRRYIDSILEMIQDKNREYYLAKFAEEMKAKEEAIKAGKIQRARHHEVMAETFKSIAERCFAENR